MIAALIALLSSSAGGAFVGFLKRMIERSADRRDAEAEHNRIRDMRNDEALERLYEKSLKCEKDPVDLKSHRTIKLWFLTYENKYDSTQLPIPYRLRSGGFYVGMLVATYCLSVLALVYLGQTPIATFDPQSASRGTSILWGLFTFSGGKSSLATISSAGIAVWMLSPVVFIISAWAVGMSPPKR